MNPNTNCWMLLVHWHTFVDDEYVCFTCTTTPHSTRRKTFFFSSLLSVKQHNKKDFFKVGRRPFLIFTLDFPSIFPCFEEIFRSIDELKCCQLFKILQIKLHWTIHRGAGRRIDVWIFLTQWESTFFTHVSWHDNSLVLLPSGLFSLTKKHNNECWKMKSMESL